MAGDPTPAGQRPLVAERVAVKRATLQIEENIDSLNCWSEGTPMESVKQPSTTDPSSIAEAVGRIPDGSAFVQRCILPDFWDF